MAKHRLPDNHFVACRENIDLLTARAKLLNHISDARYASLTVGWPYTFGGKHYADDRV